MLDYCSKVRLKNILIFYEIEPRAQSQKVCCPVCFIVYINFLSYLLMYILEGKKLESLNFAKSEKVYFRSQILERPSIGEYWNISGVPVLPENVIFTSFRTCWCYSEAYNTGTQNGLVLANTHVPVSGT